MVVFIGLINIFRTLPIYVCICLSGKAYRLSLFEEEKYWFKCLNLNDLGNHYLIMLSFLLARHKEYRNLVRYRIERLGKVHKLFSIILFLFFPRMDSLQIYSDSIGWNLFIQHGFATVIAAERVGSNCWINQQVTIGWSFDASPIIGNGVRICAGAKVIGGISVDDNSIIGANAVCVKNVGLNEIVGGVPAKVIGYNDSHILY